ncbi:hypothetical protein [Thaumasiovibrio sp. DFM-14]|uniref:hypothetical protein n=1 Tax=Thaumasiovibrio sp. DFM-14 TaxID=3384792 RepID=UPI0039A054B6
MLKNTALLLALFSASALSADHAILNVLGEIQIDGKTVINADGQVINNQNLDISSYFAVDGTKTFTLTSSDAGERVYTFEYENGFYKGESDAVDGTVYWYNTTIDRNGDVLIKESGDEWCKGTREIDFSRTTEFTDVPLGVTTTRMDQYTLTEQSNNCWEVNTIPSSHTDLIQLTPLAKTTYSEGDINFNDCIITTHAYYAPNGSPKPQLRTYCAGAGIVEMSFVTHYAGIDDIPVTYRLVSVD